MPAPRKPSPPRPPGTAPKRPVSLRNIADLAGVHISTVSAVLSPRATCKSRVSEETAERIRALAAHLKYRPSFHARVMRQRRTGLIGLVEFGRSEIASTRTLALTRAVRSHGYEVLTTNALWYDDLDTGGGVEAALDHVVGARVEGVILVTPTPMVPPSKVYDLQEAGTPVVAFNGIHFPGVPQVRTDVAPGMEMLTRHLLSLGRRKLALLTHIGHWGQGQDENLVWTTQERIAGFKMALLAAGGTVMEDHAAFNRHRPGRTPVGGMFVDEKTRIYANAEAGHQNTLSLLQTPHPPDALICSNDLWAQGALRACYEIGTPVPEQVAVVGFGGEPNTRFFCPALTTVDTLSPTDAEDAVLLLLDILRGERPLRESNITRKPCRMIIRESCGAPPSARHAC